MKYLFIHEKIFAGLLDKESVAKTPNLDECASMSKTVSENSSTQSANRVPKLIENNLVAPKADWRFVMGDDESDVSTEKSTQKKKTSPRCKKVSKKLSDGRIILDSNNNQVTVDEDTTSSSGVYNVPSGRTTKSKSSTTARSSSSSRGSTIHTSSSRTTILPLSSAKTSYAGSCITSKSDSTDKFLYDNSSITRSNQSINIPESNYSESVNTNFQDNQRLSSKVSSKSSNQITSSYSSSTPVPASTITTNIDDASHCLSDTVSTSSTKTTVIQVLDKKPVMQSKSIASIADADPNFEAAEQIGSIKEEEEEEEEEDIDTESLQASNCYSKMSNSLEAVVKKISKSLSNLKPKKPMSYEEFLKMAKRSVIHKISDDAYKQLENMILKRTIVTANNSQFFTYKLDIGIAVEMYKENILETEVDAIVISAQNDLILRGKRRKQLLFNLLIVHVLIGVPDIDPVKAHAIRAEGRLKLTSKNKRILNDGEVIAGMGFKTIFK